MRTKLVMGIALALLCISCGKRPDLVLRPEQSTYPHAYPAVEPIPGNGQR